jgi:hypothetical protein
VQVKNEENVMTGNSTLVHVGQWADREQITSGQADSFYERHQHQAMIATIALFSDPSLDAQAGGLAAYADAEMSMAAVADLVSCQLVAGDHGDLTPTQRAELISDHIEGTRVALRLAEAATAKQAGTRRVPSRWLELEAVAGAVLDRLADPDVNTAGEMAALYEALVPLVLEVNSHADFVEEMGQVWRHHQELDNPEGM